MDPTDRVYHLGSLFQNDEGTEFKNKHKELAAVVKNVHASLRLKLRDGMLFKDHFFIKYAKMNNCI